MKKILLSAMAVVLMCACSGEREYLNYRGMSMGMSAKQMADSLLAKIENLAVDTNKTGETNIVLVDTLAQNFMVTVYHKNDTITDILENYVATYNDSTSNLWQAKHDEFEKEFGWPNMGKHGDLHKEATFESEKGTILLTLLNTYSPTVSIRYSTSTTQD
ncbi:MAG: hypothetical protein IKN02_06440 [Prevotella sp.]|nr:hypothetical protein [Prevotella sp.]